MKEQSYSNSLGEATSHIELNRDNKIKKKLITKHKADTGSLQHPEKIPTKLSKEERAKIQKEKNRQAAQRSRDMHRDYVTNLQQQVKDLREKIQHSTRYCHRCQQIMNLQMNQDQDIKLEFEDQEPEMRDDVASQNTIKQQQLEPESFLRWLEPQEELPIMKIMFLVCMIIIAIIVGGANIQPTSNPRTLIQKFQQPISQPIQTDITLIPPIQECTEQEAGLVQLHQGIQNEKCLDSLMRLETPIRKSLRSIHQGINPEQMSNIMLCSLKTPKVYQIKEQLTDIPVVRLFVSGADIKKMVLSSQNMLKLTDRNIQLNGIYRLAAEIKSVQLLQHHSCIL